MSFQEVISAQPTSVPPQATQTSSKAAALAPAPAQDEAVARLEAIATEIEALKVEKKKRESEPHVFARTLPRRFVHEALRLYIPADILALVVGFFSSWLCAIAANSMFLHRPFSMVSLEAVTSRLAPFMLISTAIMLWFGVKGHYRTRQPFWMEVEQIVRAFGAALLADGFFQFAAQHDFSRLWLFSGWIIAAFAVLINRTLLRVVLRKSHLWQVRTLLVGTGATADETRAALRAEPSLGYDIVMQIENMDLLFEDAGQCWKKICDRFNADFVIIALDHTQLAKAGPAIHALTMEEIPYCLAPPYRNMPVFGSHPQYFINRDIQLFIPQSNLELPVSRMIKRIMDISLSSMALLAFSPILLTLALWVKKDGGPALFKQKRLGLNGNSFDCLKFRSMATDAEKRLQDFLEENPEARSEWKRDQKLKNDPRVTRTGNFLRKTSLDELPQLINVLKGDMSLVGPRPIVAAEVSRYQNDFKNYMRVRPGITGLWQVSGRSNVSYERRVQMDSWYVRNWSLWHDFAILCKTIPALVSKNGAY